MVRFRRHEAEQLIEVVERVPDQVLAIHELRPTEGGRQVGTGKCMVKYELPFARLEADCDLLAFLDLLPHHHSFLTLMLTGRGERMRASGPVQHVVSGQRSPTGTRPFPYR